MPRASGNAPLDQQIRRAMAKLLWVHVSAKVAPKRTMGVPPDAADEAAVELIELYEAASDRVLVDLYDDWKSYSDWADPSPEHFAEIITYAALGNASKRAILAPIVPNVPTFGIELKNGVLMWDGEATDDEPFKPVKWNPAIPSQEEYLGETLGSPKMNPARRSKHSSLKCPCGGVMVPQGTRTVGGQTRYVAECPICGDKRFALHPYVRNPACPACGAHVASGAASCPSCGIRVRTGAGEVATPLESPRTMVTRRGRPPGVPVGNPANLTAKGERMYEDIKRGYGHDPRAKEIAARTVLARSHDVPGLVHHNPGGYVRVGRMPTDAELASAWRYIDAEFRFDENDVVDGEQWAEGLAFGQYEGTAADRAAVAEMKPQLTEVQWRSIAYRADHLRADQGLAPKFKE